MRFIFRFAALLIILLPFYSIAQDAASAKIPRVLILLDGSSSMSEDWGEGKTRFQQAGKFIQQLVDSLKEANEQVEFGLRVFGHQYPSQENNCYDTKMEVRFSRFNTGQLRARLNDLHGYGVSPIAYSLSEAAKEDFENENKYAYSIILVTDGGESCNGDICKVVNDLLQRKIFFKPYIVSMFDYAPLRDLYRCLGTFLTVSNEPQVIPTISKIVDAHREGFVRAKTGTVIPVMPVAEAKKPDTIIIPIKIKKEPVSGDTIVIPIKIKAPVKKDTVVTEPKKTVVVPEVKAPVLQVRDARLYTYFKLKTELKVFRTIDAPRSATPQVRSVPPYKYVEAVVVPKEPVVAPAPEPRKPERSFPSMHFAKTRLMQKKPGALPAPKKRTLPEFAFINIAPPPVVETPVVKPVITPKEPVKPVVKAEVKPVIKKTDRTDFIVEKTPSAETEVEVYFTDGNGKFYPSTPQIILTDAKTNKAVHQFYRTVDPDGKPDPIRVPSGTFNLSVVGSEKTYLRDLEIQANMKNKIIVTVANGSLQFAWKGGDGRKAVDKYAAQVKRNFVAQPMVTQRCDTVMYYPPGNYHIEINTMPVSKRSVDLSFGATVVIPVDIPGTAKISNTNDLGKAVFYYQLGDKFVQFYTMNVNGNPSAQNVELKPGIYEVHFALAPGMPEKVLVFHIKPDETTPIELQ